jgi:hypothetical protein
MVTVLKTVGPLVALGLLVAALAISYQPREPRHSSPSYLERTCQIHNERAYAFVPCGALDEYLMKQVAV